MTRAFLLGEFFSIVLFQKSVRSRCRDFLGVSWFRFRLLMQETQVRTLVREDPTCHTEPVSHNRQACALETTSQKMTIVTNCWKTLIIPQQGTHLWMETKTRILENYFPRPHTNAHHCPLHPNPCDTLIVHLHTHSEAILSQDGIRHSLRLEGQLKHVSKIRTTIRVSPKSQQEI